MRYTKKSTKFVNAYEWNRELPTKTFVQLGMNKLGQLEDIDEELGIDLITLFKVTVQGIYVKVNALNAKWTYVYPEKIYFHRSVWSGYDYENNKEVVVGKWMYMECKIDNFKKPIIIKSYEYGKTWALTKEELEK